jgi:hypothetical protein
LIGQDTPQRLFPLDREPGVARDTRFTHQRIGEDDCRPGIGRPPGETGPSRCDGCAELVPRSSGRSVALEGVDGRGLLLPRVGSVVRIPDRAGSAGDHE